MLINQSDGLNLHVYVSALIVGRTDIVTIEAATEIVTDQIDVAATDIGVPFVIGAHGHETFDDTNDAIFNAAHAHGYIAAYRLTANPNYPADTFDLVIYARCRCTVAVLVGS